MVDYMGTDKGCLKMGESSSNNESNLTYEDASKFYLEAAISYKIARSWDQAGSTYIKLAECHLKILGKAASKTGSFTSYPIINTHKGDSKHEVAATACVDAAQCYKKISLIKAIPCLQQAIALFSYTEKFSLAAGYCQEIGELYEQERNFENAIIYYERAIELFHAEGGATSVTQCKQKIAQLFAVLLQYTKAIEIYEKIAREAAKSDLLRYGVRGYLLNAGLCHMCNGDIDTVTTILQQYQEFDATFSKTQECKLLVDLVAAYDEGNVEKYTEVLKEYDSVTPLFCSWKRVLLLRIKEKIKAKVVRCKAIEV